jgi:hypothetical protein
MFVANLNIIRTGRKCVVEIEDFVDLLPGRLIERKEEEVWWEGGKLYIL